VEPYTPEDTDCEHHVCKGCKGGTKVMKPACSWCKDYSKYFENVQLRILIQNYKKLCGLIKITGLWRTMESQGDPGEFLMDIVRESEGVRMKRRRGSVALQDMNLCPGLTEVNITPRVDEKFIKQETDVEPPDEIMASPASKLSIYRDNPDIKKLESIKVNLLDSPAVSPPHSAATSPSSLSTNTQKLNRSGGRKVVKETFILNPFKGKSDGGPFKKLDPSSKAESTSLLRKYSLDLNSEKKALNEGKDGELCLPPAKRTRLSVDNSDLSKAVSIKQEPTELTQTHNHAVVKIETLEPDNKPVQTSDSDHSAPSDKTLVTETLSPSVSNSSSSAAKLKAKKAGCRCGNATLCPGKLTCCGQRCPCYVDALPCIDCKCKGCRNPHIPGGGKVRPALPMLQNMKVLYPPSKDQKVYSNSNPATPVLFKPVKSFPEKVVYKSMSSAGGENKIVYPIRTFASRIKKDSGLTSVRMPVTSSVGTISLKDLDLSKLPIISLSSVPSISLANSTMATNKPVTRVVARSTSLQK